MFENSIRQWILEYLSEPVAKRNNIPRCPFAKPALEKKTVQFHTANKTDHVWNIIEDNLHDWDEDTLQAIIIHLDWDITNSERKRLAHVSNEYYGHKAQKIFVEEFRVLNDTGYHFIIMHDFVEMQNAKRSLHKQGYYNH
jgi:hypothetical protein